MMMRGCSPVSVVDTDFSMFFRVCLLRQEPRCACRGRRIKQDGGLLCAVQHASGCQVPRVLLFMAAVVRLMCTSPLCGLVG
jgi:hypothetical protein